MITKSWCIKISKCVSTYVSYIWYILGMYKKYEEFVSIKIIHIYFLIHGHWCIEKMIHIAICIKFNYIILIHGSICIKKNDTRIYTRKHDKNHEFWYMSLCVSNYFDTCAVLYHFFDTYAVFLVHIDVFIDMYRNLYTFFWYMIWYTHILIQEHSIRSLEKSSANWCAFQMPPYWLATPCIKRS